MNRLLCTITVLFGLCWDQSHAVVINTSVGHYDVSTVTGSFNDHESTLRNQVWFGNSTLAGEIAGEVKLQLATLFEYAGSPNGHGPAFTFLATESGFPGLSENQSRFYDANAINPGVTTVFFGSTTPGFTFAVATPVPEPSAYSAMLAGLFVVGIAARLRRHA